MQQRIKLRCRENGGVVQAYRQKHQDARSSR